MSAGTCICLVFFQLSIPSSGRGGAGYRYPAINRKLDRKESESVDQIAYHA
jgi:hypothetical protein